MTLLSSHIQLFGKCKCGFTIKHKLSPFLVVTSKVPSNKKLGDGTVPSNKKLGNGKIPSSKKLVDGTVLSNKKKYVGREREKKKKEKSQCQY